VQSLRDALAWLVLVVACWTPRAASAAGGTATDAYEDIAARPLDVHGLR